MLHSAHDERFDKYIQGPKIVMANKLSKQTVTTESSYKVLHTSGLVPHLRRL